ncbi:MAG: hypothetical protein QGG38_05395 [Nitrospinaceae bacterium]|jgi:hypothetical protein|nr:hypothetical protein [Nitrospinaceae bacterium]MDP6657781.1 hypothetical protein [Nitrospinaceae bacterium]MDP6712110.1 hypothetical protein [Nitrospinaceae bacterium]MDP7057132.1 hypothetical protein [Nitrospinaceae bacterium]HAK36845.1 hypothetical protein [Nitrospina sp.]
MSQVKCRKCEQEYDDEMVICPHCDTPTNPNIPNYPHFKGPGIMVFFFVFFVLLLIGMAVSFFSQ